MGIIEKTLSLQSHKNWVAMPKQKTNSSAKKRFTITGTGKVKRSKAFKRHILTKKSTKRKRRLGHPAIVGPTEMGNVRKLLVLS